MALTDAWKSKNWEAAEFSYAAPDLHAELRRRSQHDVARLLRAYRRQLGGMVGLLAVTVGFLFAQPGNRQYQFSVGLILLYCAVQVGYLAVQFRRFRLPDLSLQTGEAIGATLRLVRAINAFQVALVAYSTPVVFLGSLLATLSYYGWSAARLLGDPRVLGIIGACTLGIFLLGRRLRRYLMSRQCAALIARLEASQRDLADVP